MSLDEVREIAVSMGLNPRRSQSIREISYAILDAQADNRAAVVQAKEEARAAAGKPGKRERVRGVKRTAMKVNTEGARSERVLATVGSEKEQLEAMQEQIKANNHHPNKTVVAAKPLLNEQPKAESVETKVESVETKVEAPVVEQPKKKRGRPRKSEQLKAEQQKAEQQKAANDATTSPNERTQSVLNDEPKAPNDAAKPQNEPKAEQPKAKPELPDLGENVLAMGTLECAPDGY